MMRALAFSLATLLAVTPASAQATNISGNWKMLTSKFDNGECTMSGSLFLKPTRTAGAYDGTIVAETHCKRNGEPVYEYWRVRQSCVATVKGQKVTITSTIEEVEAATYFGEDMPADWKLGYVPDNFDVTLSRTGAEMNGKLIDEVRQLTTRLWREAELIG